MSAEPQPSWSPPSGPPPAGQVEKPPPPDGMITWLVVPAVMVTVFWCGVLGLPFSIVGLILAIMARSAYDGGDLPKAAARLRRGKIFSIIGVVLGALNIGVGITAAIISATSEQ